MFSDFFFKIQENKMTTPNSAGGFPGGTVGRRCKRCGFNPWIRKIPWRRKWQHIPVFLPEKSHGQRSLVGYGPQDHKRVGYNLVTKQQMSLLEVFDLVYFV